MQLYNALTHTIEPFDAADPVTVYVCGITPYDTTHLGHAFTYATYDLLIRYLEFGGRSVLYAQNVTDIDDDVLRKARELGEDWQALGNRWTAHFLQDLRELNLRPPDFYPRATAVIADIVAAVEELLAAGVAYEAGGSVYYHVDAWPDFGKLSRIPRSEMLPIANERGNFPEDPNKRDPLDFVLWQAAKPGEPTWPSPWGPGRPGWHIECSSMVRRYLGESIDVHGGGYDLIFPHHECGIAQMEPVTGKPFVRFWMHAAMVYHEGEKMSKSLGNLVMARDLLKTYTPDALRLYLARHHYRSSWSYDETGLIESEKLAARLKAVLLTPSGSGPAFDAEPARAAFIRAMDADLDAPAALQVLADLAAALSAAAKVGDSILAGQQMLRELGSIFGLRLDATGPEKRVLAGWNAHLSHFI